MPWGGDYPATGDPRAFGLGSHDGSWWEGLEDSLDRLARAQAEGARPDQIAELAVHEEVSAPVETAQGVLWRHRTPYGTVTSDKPPHRFFAEVDMEALWWRTFPYWSAISLSGVGDTGSSSGHMSPWRGGGLATVSGPRLFLGAVEDHEHDAGQITRGTLDPARLPPPLPRIVERHNRRQAVAKSYGFGALPLLLLLAKPLGKAVAGRHSPGARPQTPGPTPQPGAATMRTVMYQGRPYVVDAHGNVYDSPGGHAAPAGIGDGMGYGMDDLDDDDDADDDLLDDDAWGAYLLGGRKAPALEKRIEKINNRIDKLEAKFDGIPPHRARKRRKLAKRIRRLKTKRSSLQTKLASARRQDAAGTNLSRPVAAALAGGAVGGAAGYAAGQSGEAAWSAGEGVPSSMGLQGGPSVGPPDAAVIGQFETPAGPQRLLPLPMFVDPNQTAPTQASARNALTVPAGGQTAPATVRTEDTPFAYYKVVGFTSSQRGSAVTGALGEVGNYTTRGGTQLFLHNNFVPADNYDTGLDRLTALRANPNVRSPNFVSVDVRASGSVNDVVIITAQSIVDVLWDDQYGARVAG